MRHLGHLGTLFASQYDHVILCLSSCTCWRPKNYIPKSVYCHKINNYEQKFAPKYSEASQNAHLNPKYVGLLGFHSHRQMIPALQARTVTPRSTSTAFHDLVHRQNSSDTSSFAGILMSRSVPLRNETCLVVEPTILKTPVNLDSASS